MAPPSHGPIQHLSIVEVAELDHGGSLPVRIHNEYTLACGSQEGVEQSMHGFGASVGRECLTREPSGV